MTGHAPDLSLLCIWSLKMLFYMCIVANVKDYFAFILVSVHID